MDHHSISASFAASQAEEEQVEPTHPHPSVATRNNNHVDGRQHHHDGDDDTNGLRTVMATVSFLRTEADVSEERARCLRQQAQTLADQFGIVTDEMAPLDEHGRPRYRGRKRGRKPKPKKRRANPNRQKRKHTGYTLFVQENHPLIKRGDEALTNAQVVSMVAKKWRDLSDAERREWKERAVATHDLAEVDLDHHDNKPDDDDDDVDDLDDASVDMDMDDEGAHFEDAPGNEVDAEDLDSPVPPARKKRQKK
jgi:hypothetical protein